MLEGQRPRGVTPRPRLGQRPRVPDCDCAGTSKRSHTVSEVRGGWEGQPHIQGAVAAWAQEGLEELPMSKVWQL